MEYEISFLSWDSRYFWSGALKDALKKISQKRRQKIQITPGQAGRLGLNCEGSVTPQMERSHTSDINLA